MQPCANHIHCSNTDTAPMLYKHSVHAGTCYALSCISGSDATSVLLAQDSKVDKSKFCDTAISWTAGRQRRQLANRTAIRGGATRRLHRQVFRVSSPPLLQPVSACQFLCENESGCIFMAKSLIRVQSMQSACQSLLDAVHVHRECALQPRTLGTLHDVCDVSHTCEQGMTCIAAWRRLAGFSLKAVRSGTTS